jgi:hypothetical protein
VAERDLKDNTFRLPPTLVFFTNVPAIYRVARTYTIETTTKLKQQRRNEFTLLTPDS